VVFLTPESEVYFKSGLAKSAFHKSIYQQLPIDFYLPSILEAQKLAKNLCRFVPKLYQAHDAFLMFYKPYELVLASLKKQNKAAPLWRDAIEVVVRDAKFYDLNKLTQSSLELSILAAVKFLMSLLRRVNFEYIHSMQKQAESQQGGRPKLPMLVEDVARNVDRFARDALKDAAQAVQEFSDAKESAESAINALLAGSGGLSFAKEALSVLSFLENPDAFRERVAMLRLAKVFYSKFLTAVPTSLAHQQLTSIYGGFNGITKMFSEKQLADALPSELVLTQLGGAGRALLALKLVQKQLAVYQRATAVKPVVFVDKSGSMAGEMEGTPKISVAAGLALALYRKLGADVYLFDTEVEKVKPAKVVEVLLTIFADGGTDIDPVLEEIVRLGKPDYTYIIISDGITDASNSVLKKFTESGLVRQTKLVIVPPSNDRYGWVELLKQHNNVYYAGSVAKFIAVAKKALSE